MTHLSKIKIIALNSTGQGIGSDDGFKYFIDYALPEEVIDADVIHKKKNYGTAEIVKIHQSSIERTTPLCSNYEECGGCQLMHARYEAQLKFKRQRVIDAFKKFAHIDLPVDPCTPSPEILHYRNKIQLPFFNDQNGLQLGFYKKNSHDPIALEQCHIHSLKGEVILKAIKEKMAGSELTIFSSENLQGTLRHLIIKTAQFLDECLLIFVTTGKQTSLLKKIALELMEQFPQIKGVVENINKDSTNTILSSKYRIIFGRDYIFEKLGNKIFKVSAAAFFQINPFQTQALYSKALALADISPESRVLDAFCGVGTLALYAADKSRCVVGTEIVCSAIEDARENAKLNNQTNCEFHCSRAEDWLIKDSQFDCIFLNPPRKGCDSSIINSISHQKVKNIIYISCDPETLARDVNLFLQKGYRVSCVSPFDMFPQTMHVETIVKIQLIEN